MLLSLLVICVLVGVDSVGNFSRVWRCAGCYFHCKQKFNGWKNLLGSPILQRNLSLRAKMLNMVNSCHQWFNPLVFFTISQNPLLHQPISKAFLLLLCSLYINTHLFFLPSLLICSLPQLHFWSSIYLSLFCFSLIWLLNIPTLNIRSTH